MTYKKAVRRALDILYPRLCPSCGKSIKGEGIVCEGCADKLPYIEEPKCRKCGKELESDDREYCTDCGQREHYFSAGAALFRYNDVIKRSIYDFKYYNVRKNGIYYGRAMAEKLGSDILKWGVEAVIPVPLHMSKMRSRGYNQAKIIAGELSAVLGIALRDDILVRVRNTKPQKNLTIDEKKKNIEKAFKITKNVVNLKSVLLVDDIYTTGNTIDECSKCLLNSGVCEVYYVSICIGVGI